MTSGSGVERVMYVDMKELEHILVDQRDSVFMVLDDVIVVIESNPSYVVFDRGVENEKGDEQDFDKMYLDEISRLVVAKDFKRVENDVDNAN